MATANFASCLCPVRVRSATDSLILSSSCTMVKRLSPTASRFWLQMLWLLYHLILQPWLLTAIMPHLLHYRPRYHGLLLYDDGSRV